jgi:Putative MetA-pathway of phenol degradation
MIRIALCALLSLCAICSAEETSKDKSQFNLFNPTPPDLMREFNTDRPDKTESPYTVDAGHLQLEMDLVNYSYDSRNPQHESRRVQQLNILSTNFKVGLLNNLDFQVISDNFLWVRDEDLSTHQADETSGAGDLTLRFKLNLWGNDGGKSAFGLLPFVTFPTASDDLGVQDTEFGLILPLALKLPREFSLGLMSEFDWVNTATLSHEIVKNLEGYIELFAAVDPDRTSAAEITFDFGLTYAISENVQLDAGLNIGLTREPDDWNPFVGLSIRY